MAIETLVIASHVVHHQQRDRLWAYAPYAREIELWADLFPRVIIASPRDPAPPPGDAAPIDRVNVTLRPQRAFGGRGVRARLASLGHVPMALLDLWGALREADAVHVRCPGNLGFLAGILAPLATPYRVAKYAGQWGGFDGEPPTWRLQRRFLRSRAWGAPVTVYGAAPGDPPHVVPFFTSMLDETQLARARAVAAGRASLGRPPTVLFVGRLTPSKNVDTLLRAAALLATRDVVIRVRIVGDGPERARLEDLRRDLDLIEAVRFDGGQPFERVLDAYAESDVLVLASETEGWPKAIAEGMAFGLLCVGSSRGGAAQLLADGRGIGVEPGRPEPLASALEWAIRDPRAALETARRGAAWSQSFGLEGLATALRSLLEDRWQVTLPTGQIEHEGHGHRP